MQTILTKCVLRIRLNTIATSLGHATGGTFGRKTDCITQEQTTFLDWASPYRTVTLCTKAYEAVSRFNASNIGSHEQR